MRAHYLQHVSYEGLGSIEPWLRAAGYQVTHTRFFESLKLPKLHEIDLLIAMGGAMSVNDEQEFPWLVHEKQFIRRAIEAGTSVLGICLGAQLIANAMGSRVHPNDGREIGWFSIRAVPTSAGPAFRFPPSVEVFHWHGETFELPLGAVHLASSEGCENQAFQLDRSVIGLQFHLETTPASAHDIVSHCQAELTPSKYVQSKNHILAATPKQYRVINNLMADVLSYLVSSEKRD